MFKHLWDNIPSSPSSDESSFHSANATCDIGSDSSFSNFCITEDLQNEQKHNKSLKESQNFIRKVHETGNKKLVPMNLLKICDAISESELLVSDSRSNTSPYFHAECKNDLELQPRYSPIFEKMKDLNHHRLSLSDVSGSLSPCSFRSAEVFLQTSLIRNSLSDLSDTEQDNKQIETNFSEKQKRFHNKETFTPWFNKYIPVSHSKTLPEVFLNNKDKKEWLDAQNAFYKSKNQKKELKKIRKMVCKASRSETTIILRKQKKKFKFFSKLRSSKSSSEVISKPQTLASLYSQEKTKCLTDSQTKNIDKTRFNFSANDNYCKLLLKNEEDSKYVAELFVQMPDNKNNGLLHVKTELVASALLSFFPEWCSSEVVWVPDLQDKLIETLQQGCYEPKFHRLMYLRTYKAMLVLSKDAGGLLRHKNLCLLHSIAVALEIPYRKLLVLVTEL